jgi:PIN domain nuclease of toxin-antitoxin system
MKYIIDTHILIWVISEDPKLSPKYLRIITDSENEIYVCVSSLWELTIKLSLGKLHILKTLKDIFDKIEKSKIKVLEMEQADFLVLATLPFFHKDPFDRAIISMAMARNMSVISDDRYFESYDIPLIK